MKITDPIARRHAPELFRAAEAELASFARGVASGDSRWDELGEVTEAVSVLVQSLPLDLEAEIGAVPVADRTTARLVRLLRDVYAEGVKDSAQIMRLAAQLAEKESSRIWRGKPGDVRRCLCGQVGSGHWLWTEDERQQCALCGREKVCKPVAVEPVEVSP